MTTRTGLAVLAASTLMYMTAIASAQTTANCSDSDLPRIQAAQLLGGLELLTTSNFIGELRRGSGDPTRFDYWYGSHAPDILERVDMLVGSVGSGIDDITYNCACDAAHMGDYAYVFPRDSTFQIYVCPLFFSGADINDAAVGTLVHEISHFLGTVDCMKPDLMCSSSDPVPGSANDAHNFAQSDPTTASWNAYNLNYFVTEVGRP